MTFVDSQAKENFKDSKNKWQGIWIFANDLGKCKEGIPKFFKQVDEPQLAL